MEEHGLIFTNCLALTHRNPRKLSFWALILRRIFLIILYFEALPPEKALI
jgi:hypothetical protein